MTLPQPLHTLPHSSTTPAPSPSEISIQLGHPNSMLHNRSVRCDHQPNPPNLHRRMYSKCSGEYLQSPAPTQAHVVVCLSSSEWCVWCPSNAPSQGSPETAIEPLMMCISQASCHPPNISTFQLPFGMESNSLLPSPFRSSVRRPSCASCRYRVVELEVSPSPCWTQR